MGKISKNANNFLITVFCIILLFVFSGCFTAVAINSANSIDSGSSVKQSVLSDSEKGSSVADDSDDDSSITDDSEDDSSIADTSEDDSSVADSSSSQESASSSIENDSTDDPSPPEPDTSIVIADRGTCYFKIVLPAANQNDLITETVNALVDKISQNTHASVVVVNDETSQADYEIIVGETTRPTSVETKNSLSARDWSVDVKEKQITIMGGSVYSTALALDAFSDMLILDGQKLFIADACEKSYCYERDNTETVFGTLDEKRAQFANPYGRPMVSAHRSEHVYSTENSISGIISAVELGVDIVELDLQKTLDGYFVLCHDETLTNATNVSELAGTNGLPTSHYVSDWTLEQIKQLTLKNSPTNEKMVLLDDIFKIVRNKNIILFDKITTEEDMFAVYEIAARARAIDSIMFQFTSSFAPYEKAYAESGISMLYLYWKNTPELAAELVESKAYQTRSAYALQAIQVNTPTTTPASTETTDKVRAKCRLFTNTLNFAQGYARDNETSWRTHIDSGINIIQTDKPFELVALSQYYVSGIRYSITYDKAPVLWGAKATLTLTLSDGETAYFTMDGTQPTVSDTVYISPLTIKQSKVVNILVVSASGERRISLNILACSALYYELTTDISHTLDDHLLIWSTLQNATCGTALVEKGECFCGYEKTRVGGFLEHSFGKEWQSDESKHWHPCTNCTTGKGDEADHDFGASTLSGANIVRTCLTCGYTQEISIDGVKEAHYATEETVRLDGDRRYTVSAFKTDSGVLIYSQAIFNTSVSNAQSWAGNTNFEFKLNGSSNSSYVTVKNESNGVTNFAYIVERLSSGKYLHTVEIFVDKSLISGWSDSAGVQLNYAWKTPGENAAILSDIADIRYATEWGNNTDWHSYHLLGCLATSFNDLLDNIFITESGLEAHADNKAEIDGLVIDGEFTESVYTSSVLTNKITANANGAALTVVGTKTANGVLFGITIHHKVSPYKALGNSNGTVNFYHYMNVELRLNGSSHQFLATCLNVRPDNSFYSYAKTTGSERNYTTTIEIYVPNSTMGATSSQSSVDFSINGWFETGWCWIYGPIDWSATHTVSANGITAK